MFVKFFWGSGEFDLDMVKARIRIMRPLLSWDTELLEATVSQHELFTHHGMQPEDIANTAKRAIAYEAEVQCKA